MKKVLGLDLGTTSIGWALVNEKENEEESSSIIRLGVRVVPLSTDEINNFGKGKAITTNADRTLTRSMRRGLQRYKLRRQQLISTLKKAGWINDATILAEQGNSTTFETLRLRAKAATQQITLEEFARVLLNINKKRGYKSNRKEKKHASEGHVIDGMDIARMLYDERLTPGQYVLRIFADGKNGKRRIPDFYPSDLQAELDLIWQQQATHYPQALTAGLKESLQGKNARATWAILQEPLRLQGLTREAKGFEAKREEYQWRVDALSQRLEPEKLAIVLQNINGQISNASGYLGRISDHSKELTMNHLTVGQWQMEQLAANPHFSLRNQVFYRQDYLDEFEKLWTTQEQHHRELTPELKHDIRDITIFYQRPLKSKKGTLGICQLEGRTVTIHQKGKAKTIMAGPRVAPKSSPLFQEFKMWQRLNDIRVTKSDGTTCPLDDKAKRILAAELKLRKSMTAKEVLALLPRDHKQLTLNFKTLEGNSTLSAFFSACMQILDDSGHDVPSLTKMGAANAKKKVGDIFRTLGYNADLLNFDATLPDPNFCRQPAFQLWHLLYSYIDDKGDKGLLTALQQRFGFDEAAARRIAAITFQDDYCALSTKAMRRVLPYMIDGEGYARACVSAGYNHSVRSLTKEQKAQKQYLDTMPLLPRNSLRNPVVEKILNQMVNVVNEIAGTYDKPDEIRVELARELKQNAQQRKDATKAITELTRQNEDVAKVLKEAPFSIARPSRKDIIRYRLWKELEKNGYHTLYSNTYVPEEELFSGKFDIEHIIPRARLFDDSFSNKTIEKNEVNTAKGSATAFDFVKNYYNAEEYKNKIINLMNQGCFSHTKGKKLLMTEADIPDDFIERDLRNTQYIAKKALEMLGDFVPEVVSTTGRITDRLRDDWGLVDTLKEINLPKYEALKLTERYKDKNGRAHIAITNWTKRNDHRHHAMDALTVAFTKRSIVQYLNNLNAHSDKNSIIYSIGQKELHRDPHSSHQVFNPPMPLDEFRREARRQLQQILVSRKAKNKVVTQNRNITRKRDGSNERVQLTPRGALHKETVYGSRQRYVTKEEKVGTTFDEAKIKTVANQAIREALLKRLMENGGDAKKAFGGANAPAKKPIWLNDHHTFAVPEKVKTVTMETYYTIRKAVSPDINIDKVVDMKLRRILQARLDACGKDAQKAFSNLEECPIYLNKERGITVKRVEIDAGISDPVALHDRHDHHGSIIRNDQDKPTRSDYVQRYYNHHVAIFRDANGKLQEHVVSFLEATQRALKHLPVIDKEYNKDDGWQFLFSMKQNEYFVFPNEAQGFKPDEIDLLGFKDYSLISPNLYRVQKLSSKDYVFRHHLDTEVKNPKELHNTTWKRILSLSDLEGIVKVRVDHIGRIVAVGE